MSRPPELPIKKVSWTNNKGQTVIRYELDVAESLSDSGKRERPRFESKRQAELYRRQLLEKHKKLGQSGKFITAKSAKTLNEIEEEAKEFLEAADEVFADPENDKRREDLLKELADLVFVCYQFAAAYQLDLDEALRLVFESNMSKLDEQGNVIYRADGKVLKGPNYQPPDLLGLFPQSNTHYDTHGK